MVPGVAAPAFRPPQNMSTGNNLGTQENLCMTSPMEVCTEYTASSGVYFVRWITAALNVRSDGHVGIWFKSSYSNSTGGKGIFQR